MKIDHPQKDQIPRLLSLWKECFGDGDAFLDLFFTSAFSQDRCRCIEVDGQAAAALYWFDCEFEGRKLAYIYAVATGKAFRWQGICAALMADTHALLTKSGYAGAILVPGDEGLFRMYGKMGYSVCSHMGETTVVAGEKPVELRQISPEEYAALRRKLLPQGGVIQEGENLAFLEKLTQFYAGEGFVFCASLEDGKLTVPEFLGDISAAPGILAALGAREGTFRHPGKERPFAMYYPLSEAPAPGYFGLAFD